MTTELITEVKNAMSAFETFKTDLTPKLGKLDAFDEAKFDKIQQDIGKALEASQKESARAKALEEQQKKQQEAFEAAEKALKGEITELRTAINRAPSGSAESKEKELAALRKKAFNEFCRTKSREGFDEYLERKAADMPEFKALSVDSDPSGGYLVMPEMGGIIQTKVFESSPIRQLATVETIGTDSYDDIVDYDEAGSGWVGEQESRPETTTPALGKISIPVHELYAKPKATQKLLDDASIDMEAWLAGKVAEKFARDEATAFVTGNGVTRPRGITTYAAGTSISSGQIEQVNSGSATDFTRDGLVDLQNRLKEPYQANATWLTKRVNMANLLKLKNGISDPVFDMMYNKNAGLEAFIMGRPLRFANDVAAVSASALAIIYGDIRTAYKIVDRIGIRILRDPYSSKPHVEFYTTKRVGGGVVNFEAVVIGKIAA